MVTKSDTTTMTTGSSVGRPSGGRAPHPHRDVGRTEESGDHQAEQRPDRVLAVERSVPRRPGIEHDLGGNGDPEQECQQVSGKVGSGSTAHRPLAYAWRTTGFSSDTQRSSLRCRTSASRASWAWQAMNQCPCRGGQETPSAPQSR